MEIALDITEPAADDQWLTHQRRRLVKIANAVLRDREEAEDVVQETLLAYLRVERRTEIRAPESYLARAVRWNAIKRRSRRKPNVDLAAIGEPTTTDDPNRLDAIEIERAVAGLPVAQQSVIRLRFYLGLTFREIGNNLSISTNTAASRTRYALTNLRKRLGPPAQISSKEGHHE